MATYYVSEVMQAKKSYFLVLFCAHILNADVPFTWMYGICAIPKPLHIPPSFNPINGMVWAEQKIVDAMYRNGNKLVRELFYMQADNVSFRPTVLPSKPAAYWTPEDIGKINAAITVYRESTRSENEKDSTLLNALETIMQPQRKTMEKKQKELLELIATKKDILQDITHQTKNLLTRIGQIERGKRATYANKKLVRLGKTYYLFTCSLQACRH